MTTMKTTTRPMSNVPETAPRRPWVRPDVRPVGTIGEVLRAGSGKATVVGDPAEPGKVPGPDL